jgi:hypothetical protein
MHKALFAAGFAAALVVSARLAIAERHGESENIQVGSRPFYLVDGMDDSALKSKLLVVQGRTGSPHELLHRATVAPRCSFPRTPRSRTRPLRGWARASLNAT